MNKEWNLKEYLKEKEYDVLLSEYDVEPTPMYKKEDIKQSIETLHQKLIENIDKRIAKLENVCPYPAGEIIELNLTKKIINYLFGVEG